MSHYRSGLRVIVVVGFALAAMFGSPSGGQAMQETDDAAGARVRIVHGIGDAGPLDVYVDGGLALIGIVFPEVSAELALNGGEHDLAVVPSGSNPDGAIAAGRVTLEDGVAYYATLIGAAGEANVGLFRIDERALEAGQARVRIINGAADTGEIVPAFAGGEALSPPLRFGDASEYAAIDAGTYDLDMLEAASGASLLALPQTSFAEGAATDVILAGQLSDASLQAVVAGVPVDVARPTGNTARLVPGSCDRPGDPAVELGLVRPGPGDAVGIPDVPAIAQGYALAAIPFATLIGAPHALQVASDGSGPGDIVACGGIGGRLTETGALVISLGGGTGAAGGIAVLAPALDDPETTGVSVFLTLDGLGPDAAGTPVAGG